MLESDDDTIRRRPPSGRLRSGELAGRQLRNRSGGRIEAVAQRRRLTGSVAEHGAADVARRLEVELRADPGDDRRTDGSIDVDPRTTVAFRSWLDMM
jgi:hypothetical protein